MIGESLVSRLNSPAAKKWVLWSLESGPPSEISDWPRESLVRSLPLAALAAVEPGRGVGGSGGGRGGWGDGAPQEPPAFTVVLVPPALAPLFDDAAVRAAVLGGKG